MKFLAGFVLLISFSMTELPHNFLKKLKEDKVKASPRILVVSISDQKMILFEKKKVVAEYVISTAKNGVGQKVNSYQTPLGLHRVQEKIGKDLPLGAILEAREFHGEIWTPTPAIPTIREPPGGDQNDKNPDDDYKDKDLITSRVLWLEGLEPGFNQGNDSSDTLVDSHSRYIYIHGTNHEDDIGTPASHGCIRMMNREVIDLFDLVQEGDLVWIQK